MCFRIYFQQGNPLKRLAVGLDKLGIQRGEAVLILTTNHIYVPVAYLGIVGSGRVFSGVNPIYTVSEVVYQIKDTGAKVMLVYPSLLDTALAAAEQAGLPVNRLFQFSDSECQMKRGVKDWQHLLASDDEADAYRWPELRGEAAIQTPATINYSSGTS